MNAPTSLLVAARRRVEGHSRWLPDGERILVHNEFTQSPLLGFPSETGEEEVDLRLKSLEKSRGDSDVNLSEPTQQRQVFFAFVRVDGGLNIHGIVP